MGWFKPVPADDRPRTKVDAVIDDGWQHNSVDNDNQQITPFLRRVLGAVSSVPIAPYYSGAGALDGPHFRVGYQGYSGVTQPRFQEAESSRQIGMPLRLRPPRIPRRNATPNGVRDAIIFVQSQPDGNGGSPTVMPRVSRR